MHLKLQTKSKYAALEDQFSSIKLSPAPETNVNAIVNFLTEDQVRREFRKHWHDTQAAFCHAYPLSVSTLNAWLIDRKKSPLAVEIIRAYLLSVYKTNHKLMPVTSFDDSIVSQKLEQSMTH